ncbi:nuclear transport factor 2 family protein [uncultured Psychrobacter sp.]|uniref:nuclear transport factor 2 family protein n=1 Tax=uncultured Psychrobacter sp. TaxID=259303 RepID=UPI00345A5685
MTEEIISRATLASLSNRIWMLEQEKEVRACIQRYMALCDVLDVGFDLSLLMDLFTEDAVWQGVGKRYQKTFGAYEGKEAIAKMFEKYTVPPAHFALNSHFLTNEFINVAEKTADGTWLLLQTATFHDGRSQLSSAKLTVKFSLEKEQWKIKYFQTESLFNRPMDTPWDVDKDLPTPNK